MSANGRVPTYHDLGECVESDDCARCRRARETRREHLPASPELAAEREQWAEESRRRWAASTPEERRRYLVYAGLAGPGRRTNYDDRAE